MTGLSRRVGVAVACTVLADLCIFRHPLGVGMTLLALVLAGVIGVRYRGRLRHSGAWLGVWIFLALMATVEPSVTGVLLLILQTWSIVAACHLGKGRSLFDSFVRGLAGGLRSFIAAPADARRLALISSRRVGRRTTPGWVYAVPALLTLLFALLIVPANLVLSRWVTDAGELLRGLFRQLDGPRLLFWAGVFLGVYGLLRFKLGARSHRIAPRRYAPEQARLAEELKACLLTFGALNVLFLAANLADLVYLWIGVELPEGLTYSGYAHRGAYRLIAAVLVAAVTVVAFFRAGTRQGEHRGARALACAFVIQNLLVLAGASWRLGLYAQAYGLTRLRVGVVFWLALVAVGFVILALRIRQRRPLRFLLETNTASTLVMLTCWAALDIDGYVASWNVRRHLHRPASTAMDIDYLRELGPGALPALARLAREARGDVQKKAARILRLRRAEEAKRHARWPAWSYRRHAALRDSSPAGPAGP